MIGLVIAEELQRLGGWCRPYREMHGDMLLCATLRLLAAP
jgi:hypothetical protein